MLDKKNNQELGFTNDSAGTEQVFLDLFRRLDDLCKADVLVVMRALVGTMPRKQCDSAILADEEDHQ